MLNQKASTEHCGKRFSSNVGEERDELAQQLRELSVECHAELEKLEAWWGHEVIAPPSFIGEITHAGAKLDNAPKGIILATRLLWFFSEAALFSGSKQSKNVADQLFDYLVSVFIDGKHGGVYWEVDAAGQPSNRRKQTYAQAFAIYALCSYYQLSANEVALNYALGIYGLVERYARDIKHRGYLEAFTEDWKLLDDVRLSEKDLNSAKTMNTHLHLLEGYTRLLLVANRDDVRASLTELLVCYCERFVYFGGRHLKMFMSRDWQDESVDFSYGHDIESSWLLWDALLVLGDETLQQQHKRLVCDLADSCLREALTAEGAVLENGLLATGLPHPDKVWWVQAEAMVGFINAYILTHEEQYLHAVVRIWEYIKADVMDENGGEWFWFAKSDKKFGSTYKVGPWKGPYHNGRALIETVRRCAQVLV